MGSVDPSRKRVLYGIVIRQLLKRGWRPPPLRDEQALRLIQAMASVDVHGGTNRLTPHDLRLLTLLATGLHYHEVAYKLGISEASVKDEMKLARSKLGARNTTHAVALALDQGLIELAEEG